MARKGPRAKEIQAGEANRRLEISGGIREGDDCGALSQEEGGAVEVDLHGSPGYALPDDLEPVPEPAPWAALLPGLDVTTMGWSERDWYLGEHRADVFDTNGNAGPTAWWDGRVVGGWRQDADARVQLQLLEDPGRDGRKALTRKADQLTEWLAGIRISPRFPSRLSKIGPVA